MRIPSFTELELIRPVEAEALFPGCLTGLHKPWWSSQYFLARLDELGGQREMVLGIDSRSNLWFRSYSDGAIWSAEKGYWEVVNG
jgi:hypothetical protein